MAVCVFVIMGVAEWVIEAVVLLMKCLMFNVQQFFFSKS